VCPVLPNPFSEAIKAFAFLDVKYFRETSWEIGIGADTQFLSLEIHTMLGAKLVLSFLGTAISKVKS
jgi:hypothetical protein